MAPPDLSKITQHTYFRGRVALAEILKGLGVGRGDLVALQAFTCVAVPEAIMSIGAVPVWVDVEKQSVNMSANSLLSVWDENIKAVVVQHTFGVMADIEAIERAVAGRVPIIEDCCHTFFSSLNGKFAGEFGIASFYSFEWGKPLVIGAGGAAVTSDIDLNIELAKRKDTFQLPQISQRIKLSLQAVVFKFLYRPQFYWPLKAAFSKLSRSGLAVGNYNPIGSDADLSDDFRTKMHPRAERILEMKLTYMEKDSVRRKKLASDYQSVLDSLDNHHLINRHNGSDNVLVRFPILVADKSAFIIKAMNNNIEVADWYSSPVHPLQGTDLKAVGYKSGSCPNAEELTNHLVSFPMGETVNASFLKKVGQVLA